MYIYIYIYIYFSFILKLAIKKTHSTYCLILNTNFVLFLFSILKRLQTPMPTGAEDHTDK